MIFLNTIRKYSEIIVKYDIQKFKIVGISYQFACKIILINHTQVFVRDYLFSDGSGKYSFHWQDTEGHCIIRWDNAPHHQNVFSFPYHKHLGKEECVTDSQPMKLEMVLEYIREQLTS